MSVFGVFPLRNHLFHSFEPSQSDVGVFQSLKTAPSSSEYPHAARWYSHIKTWESEHATLPGDAAAGAKLFGGASTSTPAAAPAAEEDDDDVDLFGSDDEEEDAEAERIKAERIASYKEKKDAKAAANAAAGKDAPVAKSVVTLLVKPWDDETDMEALEAATRSITKDGLVWGASKFVPVGYGVRMLQINLVIEDEKISLDDLQEEVQEFEDYVQSTDIAAMQKL